MKAYHFGVPATAIWSSHILIGLYFLYLGYIMINTKFKPHGVILIILGALMTAYHTHLWFGYKHKH